MKLVISGSGMDDGDRTELRKWAESLESAVVASGRDSIKARTYQDFCSRSGEESGAYMAEEAEKVLEEADFDGKTGQLREDTALPSELGKAGSIRVEYRCNDTITTVFLYSGRWQHAPIVP